MANYSIVSNAKFRPFSYQEMLAPVLAATQAHQELENAYGELSTQAATVESMANQQTDPIAYERYKSYADNLRTQADELAANGLSMSSRQSLLDLKRQYAQDIIPIQNAYQRREEQIKEQRKAGDSMINSYDAATTSLDRFIEDPAKSYQSIDRNKLLTSASALFGSFANELNTYKITGRADRFNKILTEQYGLTPDEASQFASAIANGTIDSNSAIGVLANRLYDSTGVDAWNNPNASSQVWNTIAEGVYGAVGKQSAKLVEDKQALSDLAIEEYRRKLNDKSNGNEEPYSSQLNSNIGFRERYDIETSDEAKRLMKLGLLTRGQDGKLAVNEERISQYMNMTGPEIDTEINNYRNIWKEINRMTTQPSNENYVERLTYGRVVHMFPNLPEINNFKNKDENKILNNDAKAALRRYLKEEQDKIDEQISILKGAKHTEKFLEDLSKLTDFTISQNIDNSGRKSIDVSSLNRALNDTIGDTFTSHQYPYFNYTPDNSAAIINNVLAEGIDSNKIYLVGENNKYEKELTGRKRITVSDLMKSNNAVVNRVISKDDKTSGGTKSYLEVYIKDKDVTVALELPVSLAQNLNYYSELARGAKQRYYSSDGNKKEIRQNLAYNNIVDAYNSWANVAADLAKVNDVSSDSYPAIKH